MIDEENHEEKAHVDGVETSRCTFGKTLKYQFFLMLVHSVASDTNPYLGGLARSSLNKRGFLGRIKVMRSCRGSRASVPESGKRGKNASEQEKIWL